VIHKFGVTTGLDSRLPRRLVGDFSRRLSGAGRLGERNRQRLFWRKFGHIESIPRGLARVARERYRRRSALAHTPRDRARNRRYYSAHWATLADRHPAFLNDVDRNCDGTGPTSGFPIFAGTISTVAVTGAKDRVRPR